MITDTIAYIRKPGRMSLLPLCLLIILLGSLYFSGCSTSLNRSDQSDSSETAKRRAAQAASELDSGDDFSSESFQPPMITGPAPQWVNSRPSKAGFFYGIGRAEKGGKKEDTMREARSRALADLATQLSSEVEEQIYIEQSESSEGERFSFVRVETNTTVETRLPELDEVKSYRGEDGTIWYLVGLSYNTWQNWLHPEQAMTRQMVIDTVRYSSTASYAERLQKIRNALGELQEEPFGNKMQGSLWGIQGDMESILKNRYASLLGELKIEGLQEEPTVSDKEVPTIEGRIEPTRNVSVGSMYMHIEDKAGNVVVVVPTTSNGSFSTQLPGVPAKKGTYGYKAVAKPFGDSATAVSTGALIPFPTFPFSVQVEESFVQLKIISNWNSTVLEEVRNYLKQQFDVPIRPAESDAILTVELSFRENDEGFGDVVVSFLTGVVKYKDETKQTVLWRSGEIRGYGTTSEYAKRKATELFLDRLEENISKVRSIEG